MHLVGFIIRIYHDARSPERQSDLYNSRRVGGDAGLLACDVIPVNETHHERSEQWY